MTRKRVFLIWPFFNSRDGSVFIDTYFILFLFLGADEQETRVDSNKVKKFFAQSNRVFPKKNNRKKSTDFKSDLDSFKKISKMQKDKQKNHEMASGSGGASNSEELKPLPDILSCITQRRLTSEQQQEHNSALPDTFAEPDAPPNSVERTVNSYDDDFLNTECETEDIELF